MIDLTMPHRDGYTPKFECRWYKRNVKGFNDNQSISYEENYVTFFAVEAQSKEDDSDEIGYGTRIPYITTAIMTRDLPNCVKKDDKVNYDGFDWIVVSANSSKIKNRSMYISKYETLINLRR